MRLTRSVLTAAMTAAIAAAAAAAGCAADTDERPATFDYIVATILRPSCATATCHDAMTKREGLDFSSVAAAAKSIDDDGLVPIGGGDPDNSQLYYDLTADGIDKRMPIDSPLPDADIELIRQWIVDGAVH